MKRIYLFALVGALMAAFTACEKKEEPQPRPESFPKKQLIEEFTGQTCGYCPYGMDCVHDFIQNDTNWIVVLHHSGFQSDHFTVKGSDTISSKLSVSGAPTISINREKTNYGEGNRTTFHPGYLPDTDPSQFAATTYASVNIKNTFNAATRELKVDVSGLILKEDNAKRYLTVLVKESGMLDSQADYYYTFNGNGWTVFRHTNAVRAFLTPATGELISMNQDGEYAASYTIKLNDAWVPENCMVVAFMTETFKPVVQANQRPVVAGTTGGADILHGGVTAVPVSDYFPEPGANKSTKDYSNRDVDTLTLAEAWGYYDEELNAIEWDVQAYNKNALVKNTNIPYAWLCVYTDADATALEEGTYIINDSRLPGSVWAGYRDDAKQELGGSRFFYVKLKSFNEGTLSATYQWLITDGTLTVTADGFTLDGHARNGTEIHLWCNFSIFNHGVQSMPRRGKKMQNNLHMSENNSTFAGKLCSIE